MSTSFFPFNKMIHVGVILAHFILVTVLGITFWGLHQTVNNFESVSHIEEVADEFLRLFVDLKEAEDYQRGFLLTEDPRLLQSYQKAVIHIHDSIVQLEQVTTSHDPTNIRLPKFQTMVEKRLALLQEILDRHESQGHQAVRDEILKGEGMTVMNDIRNFILDIRREDSASLNTFHDAAHEMKSLTIQTIVVGIVLTLLTGLITLWKLRQDLLHRQHLERRVLEEAKIAEVSRLIGDISHDIKNMLTPVQMGMKLIEDELNEYFQLLPTADREKAQPTQAVYKDVITMTRRGTGRIQERVKEIADAMKGRSSSPHFSACHLHAIIDSVYDALRLYGDESGVSLQTQGLETLPIIRADEKRLFNAFYNLVNNAIPEVPAGGSITITGELASDGKQIFVKVQDTGRGMSSEVRESLFTYNSSSRKPGGTGLGTKIVKDVVDIHGGTIRVDSKEGQGTTFTVCLPKEGPLSSAT